MPEFAVGARRPAWMPQAHLRASDSDRERAAELLREHAAAGRLTATEMEERIQLAYGARTNGELSRLLGDLPAPAVPGRLSLRRWFVAVMGSSSRRAEFRLGRRVFSVAIMASPDIDLCQAELAHDELVVWA